MGRSSSRAAAISAACAIVVASSMAIYLLGRRRRDQKRLDGADEPPVDQVEQEDQVEQGPARRVQPLDIDECRVVGELLASAPENATCWICYGEGTAENPLVKDCSCRGIDGHSHMECMVHYARNKSEALMETHPGQDEEGHADWWDDYLRPWTHCGGLCKQEFMGYVKLLMGKEFEKFTREINDEEAEAEDFDSVGREELERSTMVPIYEGQLVAVSQLLRRVQPNRYLITEGKEIASKLIEISTAGDENDDRAEEYIECELAFFTLAEIAEIEGEYEEAIKYWERVQRSKEIHPCSGLNETISKIDSLRAELEGNIDQADSAWTAPTDDVVEAARDEMLGYWAEEERHSVSAISSELEFSRVLTHAYRRIEAERVLARVLRVSRQYHGEEHSLTKEAEALLRESRQRFVLVDDGAEEEELDTYQVTALDEGGNSYIAHGPVDDFDEWVEAEDDLGDGFSLPIGDVILPLGTPVVVTGMPGDGEHLNGKIGDVRKGHTDADKYNIKFEDQSLEDTDVEGRYLRVLFDIPEEWRQPNYEIE